MSDSVEIWVTVNCRKPIKDVLLNRGIASGNEFRFDNVGWKIIVTRTADLFLEVLKRSVEHRIVGEFPDVQPVWRMAIGDDELLIVPPPAADRQRMLGRIREIMEFLRGLLYEGRFVGTVLRAVLSDAIENRSEEDILGGKLDAEPTVARLVDRLNAMDLTKEGLGAQPAGAAGAAAPAPPETPAQAATTSTDTIKMPLPETPPEQPQPEPEANKNAEPSGEKRGGKQRKKRRGGDPDSK